MQTKSSGPFSVLPPCTSFTQVFSVRVIWCTLSDSCTCRSTGYLFLHRLQAHPLWLSRLVEQHHHHLHLLLQQHLSPQHLQKLLLLLVLLFHNLLLPPPPSPRLWVTCPLLLPRKKYIIEIWSPLLLQAAKKAVIVWSRLRISTCYQLSGSKWTIAVKLFIFLDWISLLTITSQSQLSPNLYIMFPFLSPSSQCKLVFIRHTSEYCVSFLSTWE